MSIPWYEQKDSRDNLILFGRAIQGVAPYDVVIEPDPIKCHSGRCSFSERKITVNPTYFNVSAFEQYQLTKAMLIHEAGHRRYTTPSRLPAVVSKISNILEDERVERRMCEEFAAAGWFIRKLAHQFCRQSRPINRTIVSPDGVVTYILLLRWARRIDQPVKVSLSSENKRLWRKIEPLVYEAWQADTSLIADRNAKKIVEILDYEQLTCALQVIR